SLVAFPDMFDELERLVSASLDVCEDLNSPVQLPSVESFRQYEDSTVKIGKAMARLDNKMSCFLCCRRKWQLCQIVLLQTDTRLIVIYTDTDKGFVLDLIEAKHYEFMLEEDNEGKRQCRIKIKWEFGNVQLRFVEAQIGTWQKYVLDSFDRIFKTPRPPTYLRKHSEESACVGTEQSSDDFSTTESGFSRRSITETNRLRHTPHLEDLPTMTETVANDEQPSKAGQNTATTMLKNHSSGVQITGGSSEDGSTLSMTSGTGSPTAYEGDISIVPETITTSHDHNSSFTTHTLPPSYDQPAAPIASSSYTRSEWLHVSKPKVPDYVVQPWQREHYLLEDYDDDTPTSKPMRRPEL
uniref:Secreted protein n=2 Tax=Parascaris univalens TaxID=6257 RepID=A0A915B8S8_PARUN